MKSSNPIGAVEIAALPPEQRERVLGKELTAWERLDLETMIQNEHKLYADAMARVEDLTARLAASSERERDYIGRLIADGNIVAKARRDERAYIVKMIRENAADLLQFARGRSLDLLAWILELPQKGPP